MVAKATRIELFRLGTPQMRAFHLSWLAFFACFFAWFALAPMMPLIQAQLGLSLDQVANITIAAVLVTVFGRLVVGPLCDRFGPRRTFTWLLLLAAIPVLGVAFADSYRSFLCCRLAIGIAGAGFVITQYHTSVMFAPNVVGTANATAAGWGNAGGGAAQALMPSVLLGLLGLGLAPALGWRVAMVLPAVLLVLVAGLYWRYTQDSPDGNFSQLRQAAAVAGRAKPAGGASFGKAIGNYRVWLLFCAYAGCFGIELFVHGVAATYYVGHYHLDMRAAGAAVGMFGLLALFARALGGLASDRLARRYALGSRVWLLAVLLLAEGLGLLAFSAAGDSRLAIAAMLLFGVFTHMACGATYALVPFIDRSALGGVAGVVGAGGNVGAVLAGLLLKSTGSIAHTFQLLGYAVIVAACAALAIRFSRAHQQREDELFRQALHSVVPGPEVTAATAGVAP